MCSMCSSLIYQRFSTFYEIFVDCLCVPLFLFVEHWERMERWNIDLHKRQLDDIEPVCATFPAPTFLIVAYPVESLQLLPIKPNIFPKVAGIGDRAVFFSFAHFVE